MVTHDFWQEYKYQIFGAGFGILFHSLILLGVLTGKGQVGILLVLFDFPVHVLGQLFSIQSETLLFGVGGTVMYALLGWIMGALIKKMYKKNRENSP